MAVSEALEREAAFEARRAVKSLNEALQRCAELGLDARLDVSTVTPVGIGAPPVTRTTVEITVRKEV